MAANVSPTIFPAGKDVRLFNDGHFGRLRQMASVPDTFANEGWSFDSLARSGAKGGCLIAYVGTEYVVKELKFRDHQCLLYITESYVEHMCTGETLLAAIFLHFEDVATGRKFYVMRNVVGAGPFLAVYDLKGCNDDKTLELFGQKLNAKRVLPWSDGQAPGSGLTYSSGKWAAARADLAVTQEQRENVLLRLRRDTDWLTSHQLMDYSLMVGVKECGADPSRRPCLGQLPLCRACADGSEVTICVGVIDFLQRWNLKKMAARVLKCFECNKATIPPSAYAQRFRSHFEEHFIVARVTTATFFHRGAKVVADPAMTNGGRARNSLSSKSSPGSCASTLEASNQ